ncbi:DNA mismatch repair ATPase msh1 [Scheffersomyces spartinae]|uniref:DNA mismatch repair ATPase msh1 n=1 Tax=Scheffersomyces spartinae TaxID=45513 RepID=A0A9P7V6K2_9ASCO|nr:DNA mismatch repair ATPase msh1 [Scheffersomyces spartinae]KAG7192149.1 DNA mismatch repair ATPase msh1 [Scheffersomyces spartinae]
MRKLIEANNGNVCFIQVGSFYELYFEQAETYGPKLGLKVATRKTSKFAIPMAGFPVHQLQKFVKLVVHDLGVNVAIIDQFPDEFNQGSIIHRRVSRIVSPGTLVDESFLNFNKNNFLLAIYLPPNCHKSFADPDMEIGLLWLDLSLGEFFIQTSTLRDLVSDISRIMPSEIIISDSFRSADLINGVWYQPLQELRKYFIRYHSTVYSDLHHLFRAPPRKIQKSLEGMGVKEKAAMNMTLSYVHINLPNSKPSLELPQKFWNEKTLQMDLRTREALELTERVTNGNRSVAGTLLSIIRRTVTPSGTRLLTRWITSPILLIDELVNRLDFVSFFKDNQTFAAAIRSKLSELGDYVRSIQRLLIGKTGQIESMYFITDSLKKLGELKELITVEVKLNPDAAVLVPLLSTLDVPLHLVEKVEGTLMRVVNGDNDFRDNEVSTEEEIYGSSGSYSNHLVEKYRQKIPSNSPINENLFHVRPDYNQNLADCHKELNKVLLKESKIIKDIEKKLEANNVKLTVSKKLQYGRYGNVIHFSGTNKQLEAAIEVLGKKPFREQRKTSAIYKPDNWIKVQSLIIEFESNIRQQEVLILNELKEQILSEADNIRSINKMADFLDVTSSFGYLAHECNLVRPKFVNDNVISIQGGRHLVVESGLRISGDTFVSNDIHIGTTKKDKTINTWVITGPNMGGKSTFLRQNALIVILAQMGCFVPAKSITLGIVDKIFTRIGASDDLYSDLSTFMVEMVETSNILKHSTQRSLAIVDEIGRGTSGKEGLAIAYATLLSLVQENKCNTLFATHFGNEIESMLKADNVNVDHIRFYRTKVVESVTDGKIDIFIDHKLEPGISKKSFAIEVAKMAGFPESTLNHARRALELLA